MSKKQQVKKLIQKQSKRVRNIWFWIAIVPFFLVVILFYLIISYILLTLGT